MLLLLLPTADAAGVSAPGQGPGATTTTADAAGVSAPGQGSGATTTTAIVGAVGVTAPGHGPGATTTSAIVGVGVTAPAETLVAHYAPSATTTADICGVIDTVLGATTAETLVAPATDLIATVAESAPAPSNNIAETIGASTPVPGATNPETLVASDLGLIATVAESVAASAPGNALAETVAASVPFPGATIGETKVVTVPTATFLFGSEFEGSSSKLRQQMGVSTRSKSKLSASSNVEENSSGGSVHSGRVKGKVRGEKTGNAAKSNPGKQQKKKKQDNVISEAVDEKNVNSMAAILEESTEECNTNRDETNRDEENGATLSVQWDKWSTLDIIKLLAKGGGKEAEENAARFLFAYNVALSANPSAQKK